ncbi:TonB-dependent receptor [Gelidibacter sp.]|uniref:SusC/RagA family TonB-linked outer membrane protein n=1 Tax=Gelidibacter sp. TaxID=2018083 RepID=UPI003264F3D7
MKLKLTWLMTLFMAFVMQVSLAQEKSVTGSVASASDGLPLPGVNVLVKGTSRGVQTDFDGNYTINVRVGETLVFSFVSMKSTAVIVGASNTINVALEEDVASLDEVIILGYSSKGVEEVTGSSVQIGGEQLSGIPSVTIDQALQGKVAGLQVSQSSGTPGSTQDIRIRGLSSLASSNEPLYVIDGVPVVNSNSSGSDNASSFSPLSAISSQDIASVTVLKDASATAAYGARGSNGVIVITTKRGQSGKTQFNFDSQVGFQNDAFMKRDVLKGADRLALQKEALVNSYGSGYGITVDNAIQFAVDNRLVPSATLNYKGEDYDWSGLIKNENALLQNYAFSASGGDEKGNFYASFGYNKTEATVIGSAFERLNGAFSFNRKLRDNLNFTTSMNVSNTTQDPILEQGSYFSNPFITRYLMNPFNNPYNADGSENIDLLFGSLHNTLYVTKHNITRNKLLRGISNSKLDWELLDGLVFSNRIALDFQLTEYRNYQNRHEGDAAPANGASTLSDDKNYNWVYQGSLGYDFKLGDNHNLNIMGLFEYQKNERLYMFGYGENFPADGLTNISSASANFEAGSSYTDWINVSYLGLLNYNYAGKYVLDGTVRREGSSRFAPNNRFGTFGSVGGAWNIHREDFMAGSVFNTLRLRSSYGITGNNAVGLNAYQALLSYGADYSNNGGSLPSQFGNADLTWEKAENFDVGVAFGLFDRRLSGTFTYFNRRTYDLLQAVPLSPTTGFTSQNRNLGEMTNKGIEAELSYDIIRTQDFTWNLGGNFATVKNEVTELAIGADGEQIDPNAGSWYKSTVVGLPANAWKMRTWAGVDPATGAPTWFLNGVDGEVTSNYNAAARAFQADASALPTYSGGVNTRISYKGFFADANIYFAGGHKIYEQFAQFYLRTNNFTLGSYNGATELLDRWQQPGDVTDIPKLSWAGADNFHATSSRHLYDGDYIRLKNVSIGYELPTSYASAIGVDGLTLTLRGSNVATWVKDKGLRLDPEVRAAGYTELTTPPVESYSLSVNIKF